MARATEARTKLEAGDRRRARINGDEVSGAGARYTHLERSHD
jgi:hypothetical protein